MTLKFVVQCFTTTALMKVYSQAGLFLRKRKFSPLEFFNRVCFPKKIAWFFSSLSFSRKIFFERFLRKCSSLIFFRLENAGEFFSETQTTKSEHDRSFGIKWLRDNSSTWQPVTTKESSRLWSKVHCVVKIRPTSYGQSQVRQSYGALRMLEGRPNICT